MLSFEKLALSDHELHDSPRGRWGTKTWHEALYDETETPKALIESFAFEFRQAWPDEDPAVAFWAPWGPFEELANARSSNDYYGHLGPLALSACAILGPPPQEDLPRAASWLFGRHELEAGALLIQGRELSAKAAYSLFRRAAGISGDSGPGQSLESLAGSPAERVIEKLARVSAPFLRQELSAFGRAMDVTAWSAFPFGRPRHREAWSALIERALLDEQSPAATPAARLRAL